MLQMEMLLFLTACIIYSDAVMPYIRRYDSGQALTKSVIPVNRKLPAWIPTSSKQANLDTDPSSDSMIFQSSTNDLLEQPLDRGALPPDLTAINPENYYEDWTHLLHGHQTKRCYTIPTNMTLCSKLDYTRMVLPNYLQHEDLKEAVEQSQVWVSLAHFQCHPGLHKFLCSLYAPVCVEGWPERIIEPCSELCEDVRRRCLPTMRQFGFDWPQILNCTRFPSSTSKMCVPLTDRTREKCSGCGDRPTFFNVLSTYCMAEIVIRARILHVSQSSNSSGRVFTIRLDRRAKAFKSNIPLRNPMQLPVQVSCDCNLLTETFRKKDWHIGKWIIMGMLSSNKMILQLTYLSRIDRRNADLRRAMHIMRRKDPSVCEFRLLNNDWNFSSSNPNEKSNDTPPLKLAHSMRSTSEEPRELFQSDESTSSRSFPTWIGSRRNRFRSKRVGRRTNRINGRRSLVRRSQNMYHNRPITSVNERTPPKHVTPSTVQSNIGAAVGFFPYSLRKHSRPLANSRSRTMVKLDDPSLLESEKDLFSPQNLVPWL